MKFDCDVPLVNRDGRQQREAIHDDDGNATGRYRPITHGLVALRAVDATLPEDNTLKPEDVRKRWDLGQRLMAGGVVDLSIEEVALIERRVCMFGVSVAGPVISALHNGPPQADPIVRMAINGAMVHTSAHAEAHAAPS